MKQFSKVILLLLSLFLVRSLQAQSIVYFWVEKQVNQREDSVMFLIHTTGFVNARAFGCEMYFDSLTFTQDVINKTTIVANVTSPSQMRLKYKPHSIRFFFLAKKNSPLISSPGGVILTVSISLEVPYVHSTFPRLAQWRTGLVNELLQPIPVSFSSPIVDIQEKNDHSIISSTLYPNPSHGIYRMQISSRLQQDIEFSLYDILGRKVQTIYQPVTVHHNQLTFDFQTLAKGTYFLRMRYKDLQGKFHTFVQKLVKLQ